MGKRSFVITETSQGVHQDSGSYSNRITHDEYDKDTGGMKDGVFATVDKENELMKDFYLCLQKFYT